MSGEVTDIPDPGVDELQQRPPEIWAPDAIPVEIVGTTRVLQAPNRTWACQAISLSTNACHVVGDEPNRSVVTIVGDADWRIHTNRNAAGKRWPANVPVVLTHQQPIYASAAGTATLTVIAEYHGD